jgi:hypothetical protein
MVLLYRKMFGKYALASTTPQVTTVIGKALKPSKPLITIETENLSQPLNNLIRWQCISEAKVVFGAVSLPCVHLQQQYFLVGLYII